ncbi:hypothetical protein FOL47_004145 [Perkinsus chesapeaki]|uniref:Uncharacterized protein n=1 Tax=Perkinsus chesapeaki TaxID=330153 RepID=A0A7J6M5H7_PERCH|nr:hypothetical protein FOL47_004145 [Perkinsus chesapeaki]
MSTSSTVAGYKIVKTIGLVSGSTVRTRDAVKDIRSGLQSLFGGELDQYTSLMHESRQEAIDRMKEATLGKGGNAIVGVRFNSSNIAANACEVMVYGTAVSVEEESMTKTMKNSSK